MFDRGNIKRVWIPSVAGLLALYLAFTQGPGPHDWVRWIGLVLSLIGLSGVMVARYTLGRSFSIVAKATELVTTGVYARIRNPIYCFGMILIVGLVLILRAPVLWLMVVVVIVVQIVRARREARVLEAKFGDDYRQYRARTWF